MSNTNASAHAHMLKTHGPQPEKTCGECLYLVRFGAAYICRVYRKDGGFESARFAKKWLACMAHKEIG